MVSLGCYRPFGIQVSREGRLSSKTDAVGVREVSILPTDSTSKNWPTSLEDIIFEQLDNSLEKVDSFFDMATFQKHVVEVKEAND